MQTVKLWQRVWLFYKIGKSSNISRTSLLQDIEFPLSFRICLDDIYDIEKDMNKLERYKKFGYSSGHNFYRGQSMFNETNVGWNGHTENGGTLGSTEG